MDDKEKYSKMLDDLVVFHVSRTQDFFNWLRQDLDIGDKSTNIINLFEELRKHHKANSLWCAIITHWTLSHYCNRDEAFNFFRAYNDWKIDNKSGIIAENATENQKTLLQALLRVGSLELMNLPGILSAKKKKDIIYNTKRKSTEMLELNLREIELEMQFAESAKSAKQHNEEKETKTDNLFSALEWATIFYYADETKLLPNSKYIKNRMEQFIIKHGIGTTPSNLKTSYYDAKKRINEKNDYPIYKLELIIPFLEENYNQTVTKVVNDITIIKENRSDY